MILAIATSALAAIEDGSPPAWGGRTPSANVVYQIDTEEGVPTCYAYNPGIGVPEFDFFVEDGTWDPVAGTLTIDSEDSGFHVPVPGGNGANLTIRAQLASTEEPSEIGLEIWDDADNFFEIFPDVVEDPPGSGVWVLEGTHIAPPAGTEYVGVYIWAEEPITVTGLIIDVLRHDGDAPTTGPGRNLCGSVAPAIAVVDANDIYEPYDAGPPPGPPPAGPTSDKMLVSLPAVPYAANTITVIIDPNLEGAGKHEDFIFPASVAGDGTITLTFNETNWSVQQPVAVEAVEDVDREGDQSYPVLFTFSDLLGDPNFNSDPCNPLTTRITVVDNDIPFVVVLPPAIEGQLSENDPFVPYCFDVTLSHLPTDDVYILVERASDYELVVESMSVMDPSLGVLDDPNKLKFTTGNWNVDQTICLEARDDPCTVEPWEEWIPGEIILTPYSEDLRYRVDFLKADGSDADNPETEEEETSDGVAEETIVDFDVQDNDCGALGYAPVDFNEDCVVNLADFVHFYTQWLICTEPYDDDEMCDKLWNLEEE